MYPLNEIKKVRDLHESGTDSMYFCNLKVSFSKPSYCQTNTFTRKDKPLIGMINKIKLCQRNNASTAKKITFPSYLYIDPMMLQWYKSIVYKLCMVSQILSLCRVYPPHQTERLVTFMRLIPIIPDMYFCKPWVRFFNSATLNNTLITDTKILAHSNKVFINKLELTN